MDDPPAYIRSQIYLKWPNAIQGYMHNSAAHSNTSSTRIQIGRNFRTCLCNIIGRYTCDYRCL